jgi:hypothetical protein
VEAQYADDTTESTPRRNNRYALSQTLHGRNHNWPGDTRHRSVNRPAQFGHEFATTLRRRNAAIARQKLPQADAPFSHAGPNDTVAGIHDRMPVVLAEGDWPMWLGEEPAKPDELLALLKPCADDMLKIWPVDNAVGNVRNKRPPLIKPVETTLLSQEENNNNSGLTDEGRPRRSLARTMRSVWPKVSH